jgi:hypothetical protein
VNENGFACACPPFQVSFFSVAGFGAAGREINPKVAAAFLDGFYLFTETLR